MSLPNSGQKLSLIDHSFVNMQPFPKLSRVLQKDNSLDTCVILT